MSEITKEQMAAIDALYFSPSERATGVHSLLNDIRSHLRRKNMSAKRPPNWDVPSDWDILCFAIEYVALQSVALQSDMLVQIAVPLSQWLYASHYSNPAEIYGGPDKKAALTIEDGGQKDDNTIQETGPTLHRDDEGGSGDGSSDDPA